MYVISKMGLSSELLTNERIKVEKQGKTHQEHAETKLSKKAYAPKEHRVIDYGHMIHSPDDH